MFFPFFPTPFLWPEPHSFLGFTIARKITPKQLLNSCTPLTLPNCENSARPDLPRPFSHTCLPFFCSSTPPTFCSRRLFCPLSPSHASAAHSLMTPFFFFIHTSSSRTPPGGPIYFLFVAALKRTLSRRACYAGYFQCVAGFLLVRLFLPSPPPGWPGGSSR